MIKGRRILVALPAYNAEKTLERTCAALPEALVDEIVLVDDASEDGTAELGRRLGLTTLVHRRNLGYGGNQKTCYAYALESDSDIVVMVHPDYQYDPRVLPAMASLVAYGVYDVVLASRILGRGAHRGGMPRIRYVANRVLTLVQNLLLGEKLSEYHTGYRAFTREVLESLALEADSDDFLFDNQMLAQALYAGFRVGEVSCPTNYHREASSIGMADGVRYSFGVLWTSVLYRASRMRLARPRIFGPRSPTLDAASRLRETLQP